ncbi:PAS domain S-box-containing protein [Actinoplanes lutulentus]|uniref:PAS domain S-box-containing protein n=1 Tax=Actinoplanes lutulentus TaxID=1287878 RepID=A0A327ZHU5_9ACTN|nr:PAS domain S-box protein [Actinoplanes lutulentus]MBB2944315.1 PAS domain S-box-containing protein [Actinoplanes lutulentus]RAK42452.1 PAS domain S-box-containing protein [Actinoplanes lutulentus]
MLNLASAPPAASLVRDRAVDATTLAFMHVDQDGLIQDWNPAAERLFGWRRDEILGLSLGDVLVPPALRSAHNAGFARRLVTGGDEERIAGHKVEMPAVHRDGRELRISLIIDAIGQDGFGAFISDQTDWHTAQQELQRSNTLINAILQHTSAMICAKDLEGRYLFVNGEYERILGVNAADVVGRLESEMVSPAVAAVGRAHDADVIESGEARTVLEEVPFAEEIRQYVVTRVPLTDPDGSVYGVCTIAIDDTTRRRTDAALAAGERRFATTVNNAPGMLYQFRAAPDGAAWFTFVSEGCREIFGLEPVEILGASGRLYEIIAPEDRASFFTSMSVSAETLQPWSWQGGIDCSDGTRRYIYGVSRPRREADGSTVWDGMMLDRTRERNTEQDLVEVRREVADLTDRLTALSSKTGDPA